MAKMNDVHPKARLGENVVVESFSRKKGFEPEVEEGLLFRFPPRHDCSLFPHLFQVTETVESH